MVDTGQAFSGYFDGWQGSVVTVRLVGELDIAGGPGLRARLMELLRDDADIVVDLADLSFLDANGIGVLVGAHNEAAGLGRSLTVRGATGIVARVLAVTGVDRVLMGDGPSPGARAAHPAGHSLLPADLSDSVLSG